MTHKIGVANFKDAAIAAIKIECHELGEYLKIMGSALDGEQKRFKERVRAEIYKHDHAKRGEVEESFTYEAITTLSDIPNIFWHSTHIVLWSQFEKRMNYFCQRLRTTKDNKPMKPFPSDKNYVPVYGEKCLHEFGIRLPTKSTLWNDMRAYLGIRNLIAHNRGDLRGNDDRESGRVRAFAKKTPSMAVEGEKVSLSKEFAYEFLRAMEALLVRIGKAIPKKHFNVDYLATLREMVEKANATGTK